MIWINCPCCGPRAEPEFRCGGESHLVRPPETADATVWAEYLYYHNNPKGVIFERWCHALGCRQWFNVARDTVTHEILRVYPMDQPAPRLERP